MFKDFLSNMCAMYIINTLNSENIAITHLKLQKLLYFSQKNALKNYNRPLFKDDFEAWVHGPVLPNIYKKYSVFGWNNLPSKNNIGHDFFIFILGSDNIKIIDETLSIYKLFTGRELEDLSHKDFAWINARKGFLNHLHSREIIPKESLIN